MCWCPPLPLPEVQGAGRQAWRVHGPAEAAGRPSYVYEEALGGQPPEIQLLAHFTRHLTRTPLPAPLQRRAFRSPAAAREPDKPTPAYSSKS